MGWVREMEGLPAMRMLRLSHSCVELSPACTVTAVRQTLCCSTWFHCSCRRWSSGCSVHSMTCACLPTLRLLVWVKLLTYLSTCRRASGRHAALSCVNSWGMVQDLISVSTFSLLGHICSRFAQGMTSISRVCRSQLRLRGSSKSLLGRR